MCSSANDDEPTLGNPKCKRLFNLNSCSHSSGFDVPFKRLSDTFVLMKTGPL